MANAAKPKSFQLEPINKDYGYAALVAGLLSVLGYPLFPFWFFSYILLALSVIAIVLGLVSIKSTSKKVAIAGLVLGTISFIAFVITIFMA